VRERARHVGSLDLERCAIIGPVLWFTVPRQFNHPLTRLEPDLPYRPTAETYRAEPQASDCLSVQAPAEEAEDGCNRSDSSVVFILCVAN